MFTKIECVNDNNVFLKVLQSSVDNTPLVDRGLFRVIRYFRGVRMNLKVVRLKGGSGGCTPRGIQGAEPLCGGQGAKPPEGSSFSKMSLEFVHQGDGTIITKLLTKSLFFSFFFKLKSGTANAVPAVVVPTPLRYFYFNIRA